MHSIILLLVTLTAASENGDKIFLGGLFDENSGDEIAFQYAVEQANTHKENDNIAFVPIVEDTGKGGSFKALQKGCSFLREGAVGIFGPRNLDSINAVQSMCDEKEIPHIITRWVYEQKPYITYINFYPHAPILSVAYVDLVNALEWKSFTVLYEDNESIIRMGDLIRISKDNGIIVTVKQLDPSGTGMYRETLKAARYTGQTRYVLDCHIGKLQEVLTQAQQVGLMTSEYNFFITNLDLHTLDLNQFQYCESNITGIRLFNPTNNNIVLNAASNNESSDKAFPIRTESALIIDAVGMLVRALDQMPLSYLSSLNNVGCDTTQSFVFGSTIMNFLRGMEYSGITGNIKFDSHGFRSSFELEVIALYEDGIAKIGTWNTSKGLNAIHRVEDEGTEDPDSLRNKTFTVITCMTAPYGMLKETTLPLHGNDRFEGFGIDLINELSNMEGFNYTFIIREDKSNGAFDNKTKKWTGMIGDLISGKADLAITDLTITGERAAVVDFTAPFMSLGISILFRKPQKAPPSFFSFADPFGIDTWSAMALAYIITSISLFLMGRMSADEWNNPYPCVEEPEYLVNQFSFQNSIWFTIGSLMQQGTEIAPIGIATRMVAGMWWFFVLIMVSSYTANLAAFLATENPIELFTDVNSLVANSEEFKIRYGAKSGGSTAKFFGESKNNDVYKRIAQHIQEHPEDMVDDNRDGVALAENSTYAFFMESTSIEYETERHCNLMQYGDRLDDKFYGIAMRKGYEYRKRLHTGILKLQSAGVIDKLKRKWWQERRGGGQCAGESEAQEAEPLGLQNVEGVFYVTIVGIICSIISVAIEMGVHIIKTSVKTRIPLKDVFRTEIRNLLNFSSTVKPVITSKSESKSKSASASKSGGDSKSKSQSESPRERINSSDIIQPQPYGFRTNISQECLTDSTL